MNARPKNVQINLEGATLVDPTIQLYRMPFLTSEQCASLIDIAGDEFHPSRVGKSGQGVEVDTSIRSSTTCFLTRDLAHERLVADVDRMLVRKYANPELTSDHLQIHRYAPQQQFKEHFDFLDEEAQAPRIEELGQRTWTMIVYLNDDFEGGATYFPRLGLTLRPAVGDLLMWNNLDVDSRGNERTLHAGLPVTSGTKYLLSKWFRNKRRIVIL